MCVLDEHLFDEGTPVPAETKSTGGSPRKKRSAKKAARGGSTPAATFEEKYARLEALIAEIDQPDLPLERLVEKFEEGVFLIRECSRFLHEARLRVEEHIEEKNGTYTLKDLPAENLK